MMDDRKLINDHYYFPQAIKNLRRKMRDMEARARDLGDKDAAACIAAANAAWTDAETRLTLARMDRAIRSREVV